MVSEANREQKKGRSAMIERTCSPAFLRLVPRSSFFA